MQIGGEELKPKVYCNDCKHYTLECHHPDNWIWVDYHDSRRLMDKWWASCQNSDNDCEYYERKVKRKFLWWRR